MNNMKQLVYAAFMYADDHDEAIPDIAYDPEDVKARRVDGRRNECTRFVGECAKVLGEVLLEVVGEEEEEAMEVLEVMEETGLAV